MDHQARNGRVRRIFLRRQVRTQRNFRILNRHPPVQQPGAILALLRPRQSVFRREGNIPGNRAEHIGGRDDAFNMAKLVRDQRHLNRARLHALEQVEHRHRVRHEQGRMPRRLEIRQPLAFGQRQKILGLNHRDHMFEVTARHREARVMACRDALQKFFRRIIKVEPDDILARCHDRAHVPVRQAHHAADHRALVLVDGPAGGAFLDHAFDLFFRHHLDIHLGEAQHGQDQVGGTPQDEDDRKHDLRQQRHRRRDEACEGFRRRDGNPLRHEFADDNRQIGRRRDHHAKRDEARMLLQRRESLHDPRRHVFRQRRCAIGPHDDADERDAHLHGREESRGVFLQLQGGLGPLVALVGAHLQTVPAGRDNREFGQREHPVEGDQREKYNYIHGTRPIA